MQKPLSPKAAVARPTPQPWCRVVLAASLLALAAGVAQAEEATSPEAVLAVREGLAANANAARAPEHAPPANPGPAEPGAALSPVAPAGTDDTAGPASGAGPAVATAPVMPAGPSAPATADTPAPAASDAPTVIDNLIDRLRQPAAAAAAAAVWLQRGLASWYGGRFHGRSTASGERFDMHAFSAAHKTLPLRSYARVRNPANGREVVVRVNDRGPFHPQRIIDLSMAAARHLGLSGVGAVEVEHLGDAVSDTLPAGTAGTAGAGPGAAESARPPIRAAARPAPRGKPVVRKRH